MIESDEPTIGVAGDRVMYELCQNEWREAKARRDERKRAEGERAAFAEAEARLMSAPTQTAPEYTTADLELSLAEVVHLLREELRFEMVRPLQQRLDEMQVVVAELRALIAEQRLRLTELEISNTERRHAHLPALRVLPSAAG